jgi:hypothetical protein
LAVESCSVSVAISARRSPGAGTFGLDQRVRLLGVGGGRCCLLCGFPADTADDIARGRFGFFGRHARKIENERLDGRTVTGIGQSRFERDEALVEVTAQGDELIGQRGANCKLNASQETTRTAVFDVFW